MARVSGLSPDAAFLEPDGLQRRYVLSCGARQCNALANYRPVHLETAELIAWAHEVSWKRYRGRKSPHLVSIEVQ